MESLLRPDVQATFVKNLLAWYRQHGRHDMPWRKTADPYAVFVSEFMLQQTTVATVLPYYARFLKRFPTPQSLASSSLDDVLSMWSGLGYYARARNLWMAMRAVVEQHGGKIPSNVEALQELPGVGPYTAGAVSAFAFDRPAAVLDGNIIRVIMRIMAIEDDPKLRAAQVILRKVALDLNQLSLKNRRRGSRRGGGPKDLNLALMDLGSTVCLPRNPKCGDCPASALCLARHYGKQEDIPMKTEKTDRPTVRRLCAVVSWDGRWLMGRRQPEGLFGGLWEFPGADAPAGEDPVNYLEDAFERETGLRIRVQMALTAFEHELSHKTLVIRPYLSLLLTADPAAAGVNSGAQYDEFRWVRPAEVSRLGISSITKKIVTALRDTEKLA